jgi:very-short-patch-repair endonuclease
MVVEVDGATHSTDEEIARVLAARGFHILRFAIEGVATTWMACSRRFG